MLIDFFNTVASLKKVPRQGWVDKMGLERPESVSDHTFSVTAMSLVLSETQNLDTLRVLKMSLIHDLAESITGDLTPNQIEKQEKAKLEQTAMEKILQELPDDLRGQFSEVWREFVDRKTPESILVHEADKLEMALQAKIYEKSGHSPVRPFLQSAESGIQSPKLKELFTKIANQ